MFFSAGKLKLKVLDNLSSIWLKATMIAYSRHQGNAKVHYHRRWIRFCSFRFEGGEPSKRNVFTSFALEAPNLRMEGLKLAVLRSETPSQAESLSHQDPDPFISTWSADNYCFGPRSGDAISQTQASQKQQVIEANENKNSRAGAVVDGKAAWLQHAITALTLVHLPACQ